MTPIEAILSLLCPLTVRVAVANDSRLSQLARRQPPTIVRYLELVHVPEYCRPGVDEPADAFCGIYDRFWVRRRCRHTLPGSLDFREYFDECYTNPDDIDEEPLRMYSHCPFGTECWDEVWKDPTGRVLSEHIVCRDEQKTMQADGHADQPVWSHFTQFVMQEGYFPMYNPAAAGGQSQSQGQPQHHSQSSQSDDQIVPHSPTSASYEATITIQGELPEASFAAYAVGRSSLPSHGTC